MLDFTSALVSICGSHLPKKAAKSENVSLKALLFDCLRLRRFLEKCPRPPSSGPRWAACASEAGCSQRATLAKGNSLSIRPVPAVANVERPAAPAQFLLAFGSTVGNLSST